MFVIYMFTFQSRMISNILIVVPRPLTLVLALSLRRARSRTPSSFRLHRLLPRSLPINVFDRLRLPTLLPLRLGIIRYRRRPFGLLRYHPRRHDRFPHTPILVQPLPPPSFVLDLSRSSFIPLMATPSRPHLLSRYSWRIVSSRCRRPTSSSRSKRNGASLCIRTRSRLSSELKPGSKRIAIKAMGTAGVDLAGV